MIDPNKLHLKKASEVEELGKDERERKAKASELLYKEKVDWLGAISFGSSGWFSDFLLLTQKATTEEISKALGTDLVLVTDGEEYYEFAVVGVDLFEKSIAPVHVEDSALKFINTEEALDFTDCKVKGNFVIDKRVNRPFFIPRIISQCLYDDDVYIATPTVKEARKFVSEIARKYDAVTIGETIVSLYYEGDEEFIYACAAKVILDQLRRN